MTHEITGAATWRATITSPATGDPVDQNAWDVPNQDLADCLVYLKSIADRLDDRAVVSEAVIGTTSSGVGVEFNVDSAVTTAYQDTGVSVSVPTETGDRILVSFCFDTDPNSCTDGLVHVFSDDTAAEVPGTEKRVSGAVLTPRTITFVVQALADATITFTLEGKCSAGDWDVYGGVTATAVNLTKDGVAW